MYLQVNKRKRIWRKYLANDLV